MHKGKMKTTFCLTFSILILGMLMSCNKNICDASGYYYPFTLYEKRPVITLTVDSTEINLLIDTGSHISYVFRSGLKKIVNEECIRKMNGDYDITHPITITTDFYLGYLKKKPVTFFYSPSVKEIRGIDGILGIDALVNCDYLIINYRKKQFLMIDTEPKCRYWCRTSPCEACFELPIIIENIEITAKLDTGNDANHIYVQLTKYPKKYREKTLLQSTLYNSGIYAFRRIYVLDYTFPGMNHTLRAPFHDMHAYVKELFPQTAGKDLADCLLGYPFFKKNIVCLDFKNRRIGIMKK
jgi:hypothetical protein